MGGRIARESKNAQRTGARRRPPLLPTYRPTDSHPVRPSTSPAQQPRQLVLPPDTLLPPETMNRRVSSRPSTLDRPFVRLIASSATATTKLRRADFLLDSVQAQQDASVRGLSLGDGLPNERDGLVRSDAGRLDLGSRGSVSATLNPARPSPRLARTELITPLLGSLSSLGHQVGLRILSLLLLRNIYGNASSLKVRP